MDIAAQSEPSNPLQIIISTVSSVSQLAYNYTSDPAPDAPAVILFEAYYSYAAILQLIDEYAGALDLVDHVRGISQISLDELDELLEEAGDLPGYDLAVAQLLRTSFIELIAADADALADMPEQLPKLKQLAALLQI